ncbi:MAG: hypothetical protein FJ145_01715 [Deltaproteobacteria bacterium]|nr:hypothetical protein [Deltaproteobacteria bacterium]
MFRLLLPALLPSWRFFDTIAPSPRIQFALLDHHDEPEPSWHSFRPHPDRLSLGAMIRRLFHNPRWNESLYMVTCAERLLEQPSRFREEEILRRITTAIESGEIGWAPAQARFVRFRILILKRQTGRVTERVMFTSTAARLAPSP